MTGVAKTTDTPASTERTKEVGIGNRGVGTRAVMNYAQRRAGADPRAVPNSRRDDA
jgi:hypothetical protein